MAVVELPRSHPAALLAMIEHRQWPQLAHALTHGAPAHAVGRQSPLSLFELFMKAVNEDDHKGVRHPDDMQAFQAFLDAWRGNDPQRPTPLTLATLIGRLDMVEALVNAGHDPNETGEEHNALTAYARRNIEGKMSIDGLRRNPETGWDDARAPRSQACLRTLFAHGLDVNRPAWRGACALLLACLAKDTPTVLFLLSVGADPNGTAAPHAQGLYRLAPLEVAIVTHNENAVEYLLAAHADPLRAPATGAVVDATLMEVAGGLGQPGMLASLHRRWPLGAEPQGVWASAWDKAWFFALLNGNDPTVGWFLDHGQDPNATVGDRAFGQTPAHVAARQGHEAVFERLRAAGADLAAPDAQGLNPWARLHQHHPLLASRLGAPRVGEAGNVVAFARRGP